MRNIQSFTNRSGRLTVSQQYALEHYWSVYGVDLTDTVLDCSQLFNNTQPVVLEIGFGNGESLVQMAQHNSQTNYLGIEVYRPGIGRLFANLHKQALTNVRVIKGDAVHILSASIADGALSGVQLFFPDPWHKKRHHKRRLVQTHFLNLLAQKIKSGGFVHMATDWRHYAEQMMAVFSAHPDFKNTQPAHNYVSRPHHRPLTKFERRALKLGHGVWDIIFTRSR